MFEISVGSCVALMDEGALVEGVVVNATEHFLLVQTGERDFVSVLRDVAIPVVDVEHGGA